MEVTVQLKASEGIKVLFARPLGRISDGRPWLSEAGMNGNLEFRRLVGMRPMLGERIPKMCRPREAKVWALLRLLRDPVCFRP